MVDVRRRWRLIARRTWLAGWVMLLGATTACETAKQDFQGLSEAIATPSPTEAAEMMFDPHDPDQRRRGMILLSNSPFGGTEVYVAAYRDFTANEANPDVRAVAIRALGRHGDPEDAILIALNLDDEYVQIRWEAAKALQRLHNPDVIRPLLETLRDEAEDNDVRVAVAFALGQYSEDSVFQGLVGALDARELSINMTAEHSLQTMTGEDFGFEQRDWLAWYDSVDDPFAGQLEYRYPTFTRDRSWMEKLAFWSNPVYEQPGPPAGLTPPSERNTYQDDDEEGETDDETES